MIELIKSPINGYACANDPGEPGRDQPRLSINDLEGRIISQLVQDCSVLEIGTGLGVSTRWIAKTAKRVYTVDIDPWVQHNVFPSFQDPKIVTLTGYSGTNLCVDAAFLDGDHGHDAVKRDLALIRLNVKPGGLIILHDLYIEGVITALQESGLEFIHVQTVAGLAVCWND